MTSPGPAGDLKKPTMDMRQLTASFHNNKKVTQAMVDALHVHAATLSQSICADFKTLNTIILRHEAVIRKRWMGKTVAQRRKILLEVWPDMPKEHRPDNCAITEHVACGFRQPNGHVPDHLTWPFINQEDLTKPRNLLVFLNSRGRKSPWEFAAFETDFSPGLMLTVGGCKDKNFCATTKIDFTEATDPAVYGKVRKVEHNRPQHCSESREKYDYCARRSFQVLLIQQRILAFLLACAKSILHDLSNDVLFDAPMQAEPPTSQLIIDRSTGHTSFTDVLNMAPYRGWDSLNFTQLRGYVQSTLSTQQHHVWAMREDPGYFADSVQEFLDHSSYGISSTCTPKMPHAIACKPGYNNLILREMLNESFAMLDAWDSINTHLEKHEQLIRDGASKQEQALPILRMEKVAKSIGVWLLQRLYRCSRAAPACRPLLLRKCCSAIENHDYIYPYDMSPDEREFLCLFESFRSRDLSELLEWPVLLSFSIERVDCLLRTSATARRMITGRLMFLLTDMSIVVELLRQLGLWVRSPEVKTGKVDGCGCKIHADEVPGITFDEWNAALDEDFHPPLELIFPLQDKLKYPEHKKRSPNTVSTMRRAEDRLDRFWTAVDAHFQNKTGTAHHRAIRECLETNGKKHRTAPWSNDLSTKMEPAKASTQEYQPIQNHLHNKAVQITCAFDKTTLENKVKPKTRGSALCPSEHLVVESPLAVLPPTERIFTVNKATYKTLKSLFHNRSEDIGEIPRAIKWNDFKRAMVCVGFSVEKLQGSAWQFTPTKDVGAARSIQFHEPHPVAEIPYVMARRFGRRLFRVYGWHGDLFRPA